VHNFKPLESEFVCALTNHVLAALMFNLAIGTDNFDWLQIITLQFDGLCTAQQTLSANLISIECRPFEYTHAINALSWVFKYHKAQRYFKFIVELIHSCPVVGVI